MDDKPNITLKDIAKIKKPPAGVWKKNKDESKIPTIDPDDDSNKFFQAVPVSGDNDLPDEQKEIQEKYVADSVERRKQLVRDFAATNPENIHEGFGHISDGKSELRKWIDGHTDDFSGENHEGCIKFLLRLNEKVESGLQLIRSEVEELWLTLGKLDRLAGDDWDKFSTYEINVLPTLQRCARRITTTASGWFPKINDQLLLTEARQGYSEEWERFIALSPETQMTETVQTIEETVTDRIPEAPTVEDLSSYVSAKTLLDSTEEIQSYSDLRKVLKDNPQIRQMNKSKFRLIIHSGDWQEYWKKYRIKMFDMMDNNATQGWLKGTEKTKDEIRQSKLKSNS